jgi:hypothetical protein
LSSTEAIQRQAERLEHIVIDLLTIASADAGIPLERRERIDLRTVAEEVSEVGEALAEGSGARVVLDAGDAELAVDGDAGLVSTSSTTRSGMGDPKAPRGSGPRARGQPPCSSSRTTDRGSRTPSGNMCSSDSSEADATSRVPG